MFKVIIRYATEVLILTIIWLLSLTIAPFLIWVAIFATLMSMQLWVIELKEYLEEKK